MAEIKKEINETTVSLALAEQIAALKKTQVQETDLAVRMNIEGTIQLFFGVGVSLGITTSYIESLIDGMLVEFE